MSHPKDKDGREVRQEYPKHVFNGAFKNAGHGGDPEAVFRAVNDEAEEKAAAKKGFKFSTPPKPAWADQEREMVADD